VNAAGGAGLAGGDRSVEDRRALGTKLRFESAWSAYERACLAHGQKLGDIKPSVLNDWSGWPEYFAALMEHEPRARGAAAKSMPA